MNKKRLTVLAGLLCAGPLLAAEPIQPVIVSATRSAQSAITLPASISVVTREQIEASGATTLAEVFRGRGGIQIRDLYGDGSRTTVSMRGFSGNNAASNVLILVDGRRLNNTDLGGPDLNTVSLKDVERIEIVQGSAGTLFGDQAVGGVINIITRQATRPEASLEAGAGSYGANSLRATAANRWDGGTGLRVSAEKRHTNNYRDHNDQDYGNAVARLDRRFATGKVFAEWTHVEEDLQLPGYLTEDELNADRRQAVRRDKNNTNTNVGRLGLSHDLNNNWQVEAEAIYRDTAIDGTFFSSTFEQRRRQSGVMPRLVGAVPLSHGDALVTVGADLNDVDYHIASAFGTTTSIQRLRALYAQAVVPLTDTLTGTVGARHATFSDHLEDSGTLPGGIEADDDVTVAELGLSYRLSPEWRLYARRDGNFRFPLVDENTVTQPSITALKTQTGISYEAGAEWTRGADRFKAVLYRLDLDNEIDYDPNATGPWGPFGANVNLDATRRRGMIVEARRQFTRQLAVSGDYTYTDPEITGGPYEGNDIPFVAENVLRLAAEWRATPQWRLFLEGVHIGERYQDADYQNTREKVPATDVLNGSASYERGRWSADLRVNNLTDKEYVTYAAYNNGVSGFYPAPRRNFVLTARYHF